MIKFDEEKHEYTLDGKKLISVTQLMQKHGLAPSYDNVDASVLNAKAKRGSMIHKEIEDFNKLREVGFTNELTNYIEYNKTNKVTVLDSELMIYNDIVAGTCDLVLLVNKRPVIADIKTTYTLHKEAVSWQLSIYAYLYWNNHDGNTDVANMDYDITKGQAYHFDKDGNLNVVDIPLKPYDQIEQLLECERKGEIYKQDLQASLGDLVELAQVEQLIANLESQKKAAEAQAQEMRQALLNAMEANGVVNYETDKLKVTYVAPSTRTTIDSTRLKKEQPAIADQYSKTSTTKASLRITIKEA